MILDPQSFMVEVRALTDEYRIRCLWFLREDYYPETTAEALRVLDYIEKHGDVAAFKKAAVLKEWVSGNSRSTSAGT